MRHLEPVRSEPYVRVSRPVHHGQGTRLVRATCALAVAAVVLAGCRALEFDDGDVDDRGDTGGSGGLGPGLGATTAGVGGGVGTGVGAPTPPVAYPVPPPAPDQLPAHVVTCEPAPPNAELAEFDVQFRLPETRSTASATWAQAMLAANRLPDADLLRVEEFQNHYALPSGSEAPLVSLELPPLQGGSTDSTELILRFASSLDAREPMRLVLLVDSSASMDRARAAMRSALVTIATQLELASQPDELGVVRFGGEVEVISALGPPSVDKLGDLADAPLRDVGGDLFDEGLAKAFALGEGGAPVHVVVLSDGGFRVDETTATLVEDARNQGHMLSVLLLGKEMRAHDGSQNPLSFARPAAEALTSRGGGALLYASGVGQVSELFDEDGVARRFGVGGYSRGIAVSLPAYLGLDAPTLNSFQEVSAAPYAPGQTHSLRLVVEPCATELFSQTWFRELMQKSTLHVLDADPPVTSAVIEFNGSLPATYLERSVVQVVRALRAPNDSTVRDVANAELSSARTALACDASGLNLPTCERLDELDALLEQLASVVGG